MNDRVECVVHVSLAADAIIVIELYVREEDTRVCMSSEQVDVSARWERGRGREQRGKQNKIWRCRVFIWNNEIQSGNRG